MGNFEKKTITILVADRVYQSDGTTDILTCDIDAMAHPCGLAYYKNEGDTGNLTITTTDSGYALPVGWFSSEPFAQQYIVELAKVLDWTGDFATLESRMVQKFGRQNGEFAELGKAVRRAYETACEQFGEQKQGEA